MAVCHRARRSGQVWHVRKRGTSRRPLVVFFFFPAGSTVLVRFECIYHATKNCLNCRNSLALPHVRSCLARAGPPPNELMCFHMLSFCAQAIAGVLSISHGWRGLLCGHPGNVTHQDTNSEPKSIGSRSAPWTWQGLTPKRHCDALLIAGLFGGGRRSAAAAL